MADQHDRGAELAPHLPQHLHHLLAVAGVQGRGRLVAQQDPGLGRERPGDRDALLLPAGELRGVLVAVVGHPHELEHLQRPLPAASALEPQRQRDVGERGRVREQVELLEHHADVAPTGALRAGGQRIEILAGHEHGAGGGGLEVVDQAQQRGLAGAGLAHDPDHLVLGDAQVDAIQGGHRGAALRERLADLAELDHRLSGEGGVRGRSPGEGATDRTGKASLPSEPFSAVCGASPRPRRGR
jgi:hypothetical protein